MCERVDEADRPASTGPGADGPRERAHVQRLCHASRSVSSKWPQKGSVFYLRVQWRIQIFLRGLQLPKLAYFANFLPKTA